MKDSHWFRRLEIALEFEAGFEIFLLLGRGELARPALTRIAAELRRFGEPRWHRLDIDGLDGLLAGEQPKRLLHLVHGLERMSTDAAADMAARLNVNRDRLEVLRGPVIFWIATDFYEELLRQAPDFVAWRSQATVVPDTDLGVSLERLTEEFLLCHTQIAAADTLREVPALNVMDSGVRKPILDWLMEEDARHLCYDVEDAPSRVLTWCAGKLVRHREGGDYGKVPILLPNLLLALANQGDVRDELAEGIGRLWSSGALHIVVAAAVSANEFEAFVGRMRDNRLLAGSAEEQSNSPTIARLDDQDIESTIDRALSDVDSGERGDWGELIANTVRLMGDRIRHFGVLTAVIRHWRYLGLAAVSRNLRSRGWREHSFQNSRSDCVELAAAPVQTKNILKFLDRPTSLNLARSLHAFGVSATDNDATIRTLRASISLLRMEVAPVELTEAIIALAQKAEFWEGEDLPLWTEAVALARELNPSIPALSVDALGGLGFAQHLVGRDDEAERTLREAIRLARESGSSPDSLAELSWALGLSLIEQGRFDEALAVAEQGLAELDGAPLGAAPVLLEQLLDVCDDACSAMDMEERALEFAARRVESRRRWPGVWQELTLLAQRELELDKLEDALATVTDAIDLLRAEPDELPFHGQAYPLTLLAEIHRARGDKTSAIAALREAARVYRAGVADGGPWWSSTELAQTLLRLATDLQAVDDDEALAVLREAVDMLESHNWPVGQYPDDLAAALVQLGDYAATKRMYELATTAYARVLTLAEPFPARESEAVRETERRLDATCRTSGIALDDARARGHRPIRLAAVVGP